MNLYLPIIIFVLALVGKVKCQLRRISVEENERIQQFCQNAEFMPQKGDEGVKPQGMILEGRPLLPGEYPWAVAFSSMMGTFCGGTLISQRHILTARHCIEGIRKYEGIKWWIEVGGVCAMVDLSYGCQRKDMFDVPYARAIYAHMASEAEWKQRKLEGRKQNGQIEHSETDFAILELSQDLRAVPLKEVHANKLHDTQKGSDAFDRLQIACLPHSEKPSHKMHVYGWGNTKRDMDKAKSPHAPDRQHSESNASAHLLEIEMALLGKNAIEADFERKQNCDSDKLICLQSVEALHTKDAAKGDSGTGIVGKRMDDGLGYVEAITIAGIPTQMINIGLKTHPIAREICFYTGVCIERFWAENGENFEALDNDGNNPQPMVVLDQIYQNSNR